MRALLFVLAAVPGVAFAQGVLERSMAEVDTNKDGIMSREEFIAVSRNHFARQDKNGNGRLDDAERSPRLPVTTVTVDDYLASGLQLWDMHDANHDRRLAGDELKSFYGEVAAAPPANAAPQPK